MSVSVPNGAVVELEATSAAAVAITAISNAFPAVVTSAAHGLVTGDIIELVSGWPRLTNKIFRVTMLTTSTYSLDGVDTSSTTVYPAGGGAGTAAKITAWTPLGQILSSSSSGGEQQFANYQFLDSDMEKRIPTTKSAAGLTLGIADDPTLPGYILASKANDDRLPRAIRLSLPNGSIILYNGYISLNKTPSLTVNQVMAVEATISLLAEPVRY
jgi:hypothetical protein